MSNRPRSDFKSKLLNLSIFNLVNIILTVLLHIAVALLIYLTYQYYELSKTLFLCALGVIICLLAIVDIMLFVGNRYHDKTIRIVNCVLVSILLIGTSAGVYMASKVSSTINKVIDNSGKEQYETISVVLASTDKQYETLSDIKGKKVGVLKETGVGTNTVIKDKLNKENIECNFVELPSINDLFYGLLDGNIDVAVMPGGYRQSYEANEDYDYSEELEKVYDFYSVEEKVLVAENEKANVDLSTEPFNVLLIGFAQDNQYSSYGLSDTIIVASVNPQSMTVTMTSIARDSYVPISCYGGYQDKINASRGTSRTCLIETVSDLLDMDIDFYMEVNFKAVVKMVDALGGIKINSPVEFIGQNSDYERGHSYVKVFAGDHVANGEEVLAFVRERHAMPNGDFDRQKNQQNVIKAVAKKLIELRDVNKALAVMEACGENISTNLSVKQLTTVFNYILNAPNNLNMSTFDIIRFQRMRVTGYASTHYNEQLSLPVWIYKLYNGSISEAKDVINETLDIYDEIDQDNGFKFFARFPYIRDQLYSLYFNEAEVHEVLPLFVPYLTNMTYQEVLTWANENGIKLSVTAISNKDPNYDASLLGKVMSQNLKYGTKLKAGDTVEITVMGAVDPDSIIPDFTGQLYTKVFEWANKFDYGVTIEVVTEGSTGKGGQVISQTPEAGMMKDDYDSIVIKYYELAKVDAKDFVGLSKEEAEKMAEDKLYYPETVVYRSLVTADPSQVGKVASATFRDGLVGTSIDQTLEITIFVEPTNYQITAVAQTGGTVSGSGEYSNAGTATIVATADAGYQFAGWFNENDKLVSNNPTFTFQVEGNVTYTAKFNEIQTATITLIYDASMGTAYVSETTVIVGNTATVTAAPNEGYIFVSWSDGGEQSHTIAPTGDMELTATFAVDPSLEEPASQ